jgi:miniconductance mechanosensitive channel
MVRQLAPTSQGIPLEIYCFSKNKQWANYEVIMADIFDHIFAAIPYFDLEVFEEPTGSDLNAFAKNNKS